MTGPTTSPTDPMTAPTRATNPNLDYGFIDVNTQIGPNHGEAGGAPGELLRDERRSHGVRYTLTRHRTAVHAETRHGNRDLLSACEMDDALIPIAVLSPARIDTLDEAESIAAR